MCKETMESDSRSDLNVNINSFFMFFSRHSNQQNHTEELAEDLHPSAEFIQTEEQHAEEVPWLLRIVFLQRLM